MHNTVWKWLGEKMDSLRTDGMSAKSHLLWMQEDISDNVRTWETSDMFFTPSTICCGGIVLDYFSMLMITNEILPQQDAAETSLHVLRLWRMDLRVHLDRLKNFIISPHLLFTLAISLLITRPFNEILSVWAKQLRVKCGKITSLRPTWIGMYRWLWCKLGKLHATYAWLLRWYYIHCRLVPHELSCI